MMAATAINQLKPTENSKVKVITQATNAKHYKSVRWEDSGYTSYLVKEQLEMIWKLQNEYENIYFENREMTLTFKSMNVEMEEFCKIFHSETFFQMLRRFVMMKTRSLLPAIVLQGLR